MPQPYLVVNHHKPEECEAIEAGFSRLPAHLMGKNFYCPCPYGEHSFYMVLDGESSTEVFSGLPPEFQPGTRAVPTEISTSGRSPRHRNRVPAVRDSVRCCPGASAPAR